MFALRRPMIIHLTHSWTSRKQLPAVASLACHQVMSVHLCMPTGDAPYRTTKLEHVFSKSVLPLHSTSPCHIRLHLLIISPFASPSILLSSQFCAELLFSQRNTIHTYYYPHSILSITESRWWSTSRTRTTCRPTSL